MNKASMEYHRLNAFRFERQALSGVCDPYVDVCNIRPALKHIDSIGPFRASRQHPP